MANSTLQNESEVNNALNQSLTITTVSVTKTPETATNEEEKKADKPVEKVVEKKKATADISRLGEKATTTTKNKFTAKGMLVVRQTLLIRAHTPGPVTINLQVGKDYTNSPIKNTTPAIKLDTENLHISTYQRIDADHVSGCGSSLNSKQSY